MLAGHMHKFKVKLLFVVTNCLSRSNQNHFLLLKNRKVIGKIRGNLSFLTSHSAVNKYECLNNHLKDRYCFNYYHLQDVLLMAIESLNHSFIFLMS